MLPELKHIVLVKTTQAVYNTVCVRCDNDHMDLIAELEDHRKREGLKKSDMARLFSVEPQNYNNWVYRNSLPKDHYGVAYAILGRDNESVEQLNHPSYSIPLISWVAAGHWCESPDSYEPGDAEDWLPAPKNAGSRTFALRVINDSMTSTYPGQRSYPHGTIIYVDPDKSVTNGTRVVARANGEYTFKSYIEDAGRKYLKPINPTYDKIDITEDVHICGVVIGSYMPE